MTTFSKPGVYAVNENGEMMQDLIMCRILGVDKLPEGYMVEFVNGNTLDCRRANLRLVKIEPIQ
jgi:hypothetical protein